MTNRLPDFLDFAAALSDSARLIRVYSEWLDEILSAPLWSPNTQEGFRIPWHKAAEAAKSQKADFDCPGLYLFGSYRGVPRKDVPRYIGAAGVRRGSENTLRKRIFSRYVPGPRTKPYQGNPDERLPKQCEIAEYYGPKLIKQGVSGLPSYLIEQYKKNFPRNKGLARLKYAEDFARHGIDGIWLAVLPAVIGTKMATSETIKELETSLIGVGRHWNKAKGYPDLVNERD